MSGPFKMKGNPMKRNFGIGVSPMREKEEKKTFSTQEEDPNAKNIKKSKKSKSSSSTFSFLESYISPKKCSNAIS